MGKEGTPVAGTPKLGTNGVDLSSLTSEEKLVMALEEESRMATEARACTGVLGIHPLARDIKIDNFSVTFYGAELLQDTKLELSCGNRYGLMGVNGCGKSTLLACLGNREVPIQEHIDIYYLAREIPASEKTALEAVMEADEERVKLEALAEMLALETDDASQEYLMQVYERLDDLGADTAESRAAHLLMGLQFTPAMQNKKCKDFSGGWRRRWPRWWRTGSPRRLWLTGPSPSASTTAARSPLRSSWSRMSASATTTRHLGSTKT